MNQLALDFVPDRKRTAIGMVANRPLWFRKDFAAYLTENWRVYEAFERQANRIWERGRRHYSQRTIIEVLRHESALTDNDPDFRLNDKWTKDLARLWVCFYPEKTEMFEFRNGQSAVRAA